MAYPHSGNGCSGLCVLPCEHPDCWQCAKERALQRDQRDQEALLRLTKAAERAGAKSILSGVLAQKPNDWQKATITRGALEALAAKAGIRMDWNNGTPVFYDEEVHDMERRYEKAHRQALEEKVKELEKIAAQQKADNLSERAASSLAAAAVKQMDTMVGDIVKNRVEATLRDDMVANEKRVKDSMRASGASEADIAAVEKLLATKALPEDPHELTNGELKLKMNRDFSSVVSEKLLKRMEETLRSNIFGAPGPYTAIVHPDVLKGDPLGWKVSSAVGVDYPETDIADIVKDL